MTRADLEWTAEEPTSGFGLAARDALQLLSQRLGLEVCLLARYDGERFVVLQSYGDGLTPGSVMAWSTTVCARMADGQGPVIAPDISQVPAYRKAVDESGSPVAAYAGVALRDRDGRLLGSLCGVSATRRTAALAEELPLLQTLGQLLEKLPDHELRADGDRGRLSRVEREARTDAMTGLLNWSWRRGTTPWPSPWGRGSSR